MAPYQVLHLFSSYDGKATVHPGHDALSIALQGNSDWIYHSASTWRQFEELRSRDPVADLWLVGLRLSGGYIQLLRDGYVLARGKVPKVCLLVPDSIGDLAKELRACDADSAIRLSDLSDHQHLPTRNRSIREVIQKLLVPK